jgi:hypothetical protein
MLSNKIDEPELPQLYLKIYLLTRTAVRQIILYNMNSFPLTVFFLSVLLFLVFVARRLYAL